jgi:hypothetical protein
MATNTQPSRWALIADCGADHDRCVICGTSNVLGEPLQGVIVKLSI